MRTGNCVVVFVWLLAGPPPDVTYAATDEERVQYLLAGARDARERLLSAVVHASGTFFTDQRESAPFEGPLRYSIAFDYTTSRFRFDRDKPARREREGGLEVFQYSTKQVELQDYVIAWGSLHENADFHRLDAENWQKYPGEAFDVRTLGMSSGIALKKRRGIAKTCEGFLTRPIESVDEVPGGLTKISLLSPPEAGVRVVLWINEGEGFTPVRQEVWEAEFSMEGQPIPGKWRPQPSILTEMTWKQVGEDWVPATWLMEERGRASLERHQLTFDWQYVNQKVPEEYFTLEGMKIDPDHDMIDYRLGSPISLGSVRDVIVGKPSDAADEPPASWTSRGITVAVMVLVGLLFAFFVSRTGGKKRA